jgi:hypothetical protein
MTMDRAQPARHNNEEGLQPADQPCIVPEPGRPALTERSLFLALFDIEDPAARLAYLDQACAGSAALRTQVEQLLIAHDGLGNFMQRPARELVAGEGDKPPVSEGPHSFWRLRRRRHLIR